jgi:hypothetical protein
MLPPVADEQKPPVAIRITRPYATEAEFLEREFDTLTRTSVVLLGAQVRPQGVVLRFEIVLKGGESILRGEGRVVGHKENAHGGESGLTLRFTRLDSRSKTLVDRASALREARARGSASMAPAAAPAAPPVPAPEPTPPPAGSRRTGPPPLPESVRAEAIEPPATAPTADIETTQVDAHFKRAAPPPPEPPPSPPRAKADRPAPKKSPPAAKPAPQRPANAATGRAGTPIDRPADREGLLTRLRTRAETLPSARVQEILAKRAR